MSISIFRSCRPKISTCHNKCQKFCNIQGKTLIYIYDFINQINICLIQLSTATPKQ